jgi:Peptidase family U32
MLRTGGTVMDETREFLRRLGLPSGDRHDLPSSMKRFPDGAQYRFEIPSCEGPAAMRAVIEEAGRHGIVIQRVSQGSGIMLLSDQEIGEMSHLGHEHGMEVSLFVGPRAGWDVGATAVSPAGRTVAPRLRGADQLVYAVEDVRRACTLGIRSVLVADEGLLWVLGEMIRASVLPRDLVLKVSVMMGSANPAAVAVMARLGAGTYNIPTDLTLAQIAAIRQAVDIPLDVYVEAPDDLGGFVRHFEIPELIRVAAPVYVKFGLRNAPNIYPSGTHLEGTAVALTRERVRRAALGAAMIRRYAPELIASPVGAPGLGIPVAAATAAR